MGLDIHFSQVNKLDYSLNKKTAIHDKIDIGYFRNVNCLLPHFGYVDNCEYLEIEKWQIEDLVYKAKELLSVYNTISYQLHLQSIEVNYYKEIYKCNQEMCDERCKPFLKKINELCINNNTYPLLI